MKYGWIALIKMSSWSTAKLPMFIWPLTKTHTVHSEDINHNTPAVSFVSFTVTLTQVTLMDNLLGTER